MKRFLAVLAILLSGIIPSFAQTFTVVTDISGKVVAHTNFHLGKTLWWDTTTSAGLQVNRLTTTQRNALTGLTNGMVIYNTTAETFQFRQLGAWVDLGTGSGGGSTNGDAISINSVALADTLGANFIDTATFVWGLNTGTTPDAITGYPTNISNSQIVAGAGIDASKLANGTVSNAELQFIAGLTSDAQAQINTKGVGTVTSVGLSMPNQFQVSGNPQTGVGAFGVTLTNFSGTGGIALTLAPLLTNATLTTPTVIGKFAFSNIPTNGAVVGQVLKFDGTIFTPQNDSTAGGSTNVGIFVNGAPITDGNLANSATANLSVTGSTNISITPTNLINNQILATAAIDKSKIATNNLWLPADLGTGTADDNGFLRGDQAWTRSVIDGQVPRISGGALAFGTVDLANGSSVSGTLSDGNLSANVALLNNPNLALLDKENHFSNTNSFDIPITTAGLVSTQGLVVVGSGQGFVGFQGTTAFTNFISTVDPTGNGWFLLPNIPGTNTIAVVSQLSTAVTNYWPVVNAGVGYGLDTNSVDNTAAIQAAINNATNDIGFAGATFGKRVFIPAGLYNVDGSLNVYPGITLEGETAPRSTGTRLYKNTSGPLIIVHNPGAVAIRNLSLASDAIATGAQGIVSSTNGTVMTDVLIENVYLRLFATAVTLTNVTDVRILGGGTAVNTVGYKIGPGAHHVVLDGVKVEGGSGASDGVLVNGSTSTDINVLNSSFRTTLTYGVRATNNSVGGVGGMSVSFTEFESVTYPLYFNGTSEVLNSVRAIANTFRSAGTNIYANFVTGLTTLANRSTGNQPMIVIASTVRGLNMYGDDWPSTATPIVGTPAWGIFAFSNIVVTGGTISASLGMTNTGITYNYTDDPAVNTTTNWTVGFGGGTNTYSYMDLVQTNNIFFQYSTNRAPVRSLAIHMNSGGADRVNTLNTSWKLLGGLTTPFTVTNGTSAVLSLTCFAGGDVGVSETNVVAAISYHPN